MDGEEELKDEDRELDLDDETFADDGAEISEDDIDVAAEIDPEDDMEADFLSDEDRDGMY